MTVHCTAMSDDDADNKFIYITVIRPTSPVLAFVMPIQLAVEHRSTPLRFHLFLSPCSLQTMIG